VSDSQYKLTVPPLANAGLTALALSWPRPLISTPWAKAMEAQDTVFNGRRILLAYQGGGSNEWQVGNFTVGEEEVTQEYPEVNTWRATAKAFAERAPGQALQFRALCVPSGLTQHEVPTALWNPAGVGGTIRVSVEYDNGTDTTSLTRSIGVPGSDEDMGFEPATFAASWKQIKHIYIPDIRPPEVAAAEIAKWSELPKVGIELAFRGGIRCIAANLSEVPWKHVIEHDDTATTMHDALGDMPSLQFPQEKAQDPQAPSTNTEPRFGTLRSLAVAERQEKRMGPIICSWGTHTEAGAEVTDTEPDAFSWSNTTPQGLFDSGQEGWSPDAPGWDIPAAYCLQSPTNLTTRLRDNAAAIPVRLRVWARCTTDAAGFTGTVRIATSARSQLDILIPEESTWAEYTVTGYLEANWSTKHAAAIIQPLVFCDGGTFEMRYGSVQFGEFTTA
jgi:hypothetical protein